MKKNLGIFQKGILVFLMIVIAIGAVTIVAIAKTSLENLSIIGTEHLINLEYKLVNLQQFDVLTIEKGVSLINSTETESDRISDDLETRHSLLINSKEIITNDSFSEETSITLESELDGVEPMEQVEIWPPSEKTENEVNFPEDEANLLTDDCLGLRAFYIFGTITDYSNDIDLFKITVPEDGVFDIFGIWVTGLPSQDNLHEDLTLFIENTNGEGFFSQLYDSGTDLERQVLLVQVPAGTYYIGVLASTSHGTRYVNEGYGLRLDFYPDLTVYEAPVKVSNTMTYPWNTIGCLVSTFPNGEKYWGTGTLISQYTVLTSAHMLYDSSKGGEAVSVEFSPGQYQETPGGEIIRPYGSGTTDIIDVDNYYINYERSSYDIAAAHFSEPFLDLTEFLSVQDLGYISDSANFTGYPAVSEGEYTSNSMWSSYGENIWRSSYLSVTDAYSAKGSSGSLAWVYEQDTETYKIAGILSTGSYFYTAAAINCTYAIGIDLRDWKYWVPEAERGIKGYIEFEGKEPGDKYWAWVIITHQDMGATSWNFTLEYDGAFQFDDIENGNYTLQIQKRGYLTRQIKDVFVQDNVLIISDIDNPIIMWAGDSDYKTGVDTGDLARAIASLGLVEGDEGYNGVYDFNDENGVDTGDLALVIKNLGLTSDDYPDWIW